jgi:DNA-binding CsgD family transcriptional regulator
VSQVATRMAKSAPATRRTSGGSAEPRRRSDVRDRSPIRYLKAGEPLPPGEPRRYLSSGGYVRLRWRVGSGYVEAWEHRVVVGALPGEHVHHRNEKRDDNALSNLEKISASEHSLLHAHDPRPGRTVLPPEEIASLYRAGETTIQIGQRFGVSPGSISKVLTRHRIETRTSFDYKRLPISDEEIVRLFKEGMRPPAIARQLGCCTATVRNRLHALGVPQHRPGRPMGRTKT